MTKQAATWGEIAQERDLLIDAVQAFTAWHGAVEAYQHTAYKGDGRRSVDAARTVLDKALAKVNPIVDKYRR